MATDTELMKALSDLPIAERFEPYCEFSPASDALTVYLKPDADYSKRLTNHVTLLLAIDSHEIVGCRIKGISGLLEDLPNFIAVKHGTETLNAIFWSFRGSLTSDDERQALNELVQCVREKGMAIDLGNCLPA